jgi:hypothetical protein
MLDRQSPWRSVHLGGRSNIAPLRASEVEIQPLVYHAQKWNLFRPGKVETRILVISSFTGFVADTGTFKLRRPATLLSAGGPCLLAAVALVHAERVAVARVKYSVNELWLNSAPPHRIVGAC